MAEWIGHLTLIGDDFDLPQVTEALSCEPSWLRRKEEVLGNGRLFGHCEWGVETNLIVADEIYPVTDALTALLPCSPQTLAEIAGEHRAEWNILFYIKVTDSFPVIEFTSDFIRFAAEIRASIGFDVYGVSKDGEDSLEE